MNRLYYAFSHRPIRRNSRREQSDQQESQEPKELKAQAVLDVRVKYMARWRAAVPSRSSGTGKPAPNISQRPPRNQTAAGEDTRAPKTPVTIVENSPAL